MKAVIQRVKNASVSVGEKTVGSCEKGFLILVCACEGDCEEDIEILAKKTANLRVFCDENDKMNLSLLDIDGEALVVSQFTLCADVKKGNRPSFTGALEPVKASLYYDRFCELLKENGVNRVEKGIFGADMQISLLADGPVTINFDTKVWCNREN